MFDKQKLFETAVNHMRKQGEVAISDGVCSYRTPEGLKCAVGAFIPDEAYTPEIERRGASHPLIARDIFGLHPEADAENINFLCSLQQYLHDDLRGASGETFMSRLERYIAYFAEIYRLTIPSKETTNV